MSYAIIESGGKQFRVSEGQEVRVPTLDQQPGGSVEFDALLHGDGETVKIGSPVVDGARVKATVVGHGRANKIIVFKMKRKKQYKRTHGHRQNYTTIKIDSIGPAGE